MTVFSDCLTRLAGLFGSGPKPPDCCGDFGGGDSGTDDDDQDDSDESCGNSCASYGFCARDTEDFAYGTVNQQALVICYNQLPEEIRIILDCGDGGEFTGWPDEVEAGNPGGGQGGGGSAADVLYQHIAGLLSAQGAQTGTKAILNGSPPCQTFKCDFAYCPTLPTATCPDSNCVDDDGLPGNTIGYFPCDIFESPCRNDCDQVFNIDYNPAGTKYRTMAACLISDCCIDPYPPDPSGFPECILYKCIDEVCEEKRFSIADLEAQYNWDQDDCPQGQEIPGYFASLVDCEAFCTTDGDGPSTPGVGPDTRPTTPPPPPPALEPAPAPGPGDDTGGGGGGGAGAPGAPDREALCRLYYCDGETLVSVLLSISQIQGLSSAIPGNAQTCDEIPSSFIGNDEVFYSKTPLTCGPQGGGGAGSPGAPYGAGGSAEKDLGSFGNENRVGSDGIRREYASYESNRVVNPNLSNLPRVKSRNFIPITNRGFRTDIFGSKIHYAIESIDQIMSDSIPYSDIPFSELTLANLKDSLSDDLKKRFDSIKSSRSGVDLINRILRTIKKHIFEGRIYDIDYTEIVALLDNFDDRDLKFKSRSVAEVAAVNHMIENARTIDVSKFSEAPKEEIRLWKLVAPDVEKHLPILLNDGSLDKVFIDQDDSFDLTLSDGSTSASYIKDGDIYDLATPGYVSVQYDRDRTVVLDLNDTEKIFNMLGQEYSVVIDVSTLESADIEATASLTTPRQEVYLLKLDPTSIEDLDRTNDLIRVSKSKYTLMDESEIDEWIQYKPFPFSTFYLDHEDPFFDHLEESEHVFITSKDFALDSFAGYEDDLPILPRRLPWSVAIIATDRVDLQDGISRSSLVAINRRSVTFRRNSMKKDVGTNHPLFDFNLVGKGGGAVPDAPTNNQMRFTFNKSKLDNMGPRIKSDNKTRRPSPVRELFTALRDAKTEESFIDSKGTTVPWPVVFNKMSISARKRLGKEIVDYKNFRSKVALNKIATDETIKSKFPKVSNVPVFGGDINLNNYTFSRRVTKIDGSDFKPEDIQPL